ncbi:uncharacterized protein LOC109420058 [Aedes albopictus]|uniref:Integrase catalytic domain-containing protein n=1 Tax=Aedes albopictus TaxID=7160 RepID=A0ABM1Y3M2_AEDAL
MKHLEERLKVMQLIGDAGDDVEQDEEDAVGVDPDAQEFYPSVDPFHLSQPSFELSRSQLAARQAVAKELPIFSGAPEEWPLFIATYENTTRMCGYSDEENLLRLQRSLKGKAMEAVRSRLLYPVGLPGVLQTLRTLFGRPEVIIHSLVYKIRNMPSPRTEKLSTLIDFGIAVQNMCATIKACGLDEQLYNVALLQELVDRLPSTIKLNWALHRQTLPSATLSNFSDWLEMLVEAACAVTIPSSVTSNPSKTEKRTVRREDLNVHFDSDLEKNGTSKPTYKTFSKDCLICHGNCRSVVDCEKFQQLGVGDRWVALKQHRLCRKCLKKHFGACDVKSPCGRNGCTYMHHEMLHDDLRYGHGQSQTTQEIDNVNVSSAQSCNTHVSLDEKNLFRYVPVVLHGHGVSVETYAFMDDGSSATFMEHSLLQELKLEGKPTPLCLSWTADQHREENESVKLSIEISGIANRNKRYELQKVHTVRRLALPKQTVEMDTLAEKYKHLEGLPIASYHNVSPRILLGVDNCRLGYALNSREGSSSEPIASRTRLGWVVYGPCSQIPAEPNQTYTAHHSYHICSCSEESDADLHKSVKEYFTLENLGVKRPEKQIMSKDDERAVQLLESQTRCNGTRYETGLLWKYSEIKLPQSRQMATKRLLCLERKLEKDPALFKALNDKLKEYEGKGYVRKMLPSEIDDAHPRSWYLPIFPVKNPNKPDKLRIVWDAAAKVNGVSLNSVLFKGPDLVSSIVAILWKFREFKIAVAADIVEMFHQVIIKPTDQHSQKFLWRSCDTSREPEVYTMTVMIFGATCSPSCAQFVKNRNAQRFASQFPRAVEAVVDEHYVDDMLTSVELEVEAEELARQVEYIHGQAGFQIHNWLSNSQAVLDAMGAGNVSEKSLNTITKHASDKVLGLWWCTTTDEMTFKIPARQDSKLLLGHRTPTKREVLSTLMTVYDPLGLIGNFLMFLKTLLQEIWRSGVAWDEPIAQKQMEKWQLWIKVLPRIEAVRIPRCYRSQTTTSEANDIQLHVFVDASENGYAAVAYLRFEEHGIIECALIGSKTRVAPLRFVSIPRLELQAAVLGARFANSIQATLKLKPSSKFFWSDSRDVICWLNSDHRRYSQFVGCRVGEILELSEVSEWHWIASKMNVADDATKWKSLPNLSSRGRWFKGPPFLWEPKPKWPITPKSLGSTELELRAYIQHHAVEESVINMHNFSRWGRLVRHIAFVKRFPSNIRRKLTGERRLTGPLIRDELKQAEKYIFRKVQSESFAEEVHILQNADPEPWRSKRKLLKHSSLYRLSPYIDDDGVLRMKGRIGACEYASEEMKHPILLPKRHHVTDLIVLDVHQRHYHQNHQTVLNEVRQKYYIPSLRSVYRNVRSRCQLCKVRNATPQQPMMGDLPPMRLKPFVRPFSFVGIDYFGPFQVMMGRRVEKRWGVLITCMTVRAVHIEVAHSLSTESCILAIRNFVARRGMPLEIISDRGTNFIGASRELKDALQKMDQNKLIESFVSVDTKWSFNPPATPHFGGCWERLIQSVKKSFNHVKPNRTPSDELLRNMLTEIEFVINCRPLTEIPLENEEASPLTPNHFLIGSSSGSKAPIAFNDSATVVTNSWKMSLACADQFWRRWVAEYLPTLTKRTKWFQPAKPLEIGDIVVVVDERLPRNSWPKGRIIEVSMSKDGQVRRASVQTANGIFERSAANLALIDVVGSTVSKSDP